MGIYRRFLGGLESEESKDRPPVSQRKLTPATLISVSRPAVAAYVSYKLVTGKRGIALPLAYAGLSDSEGHLARAIDTVWPDAQLGVSETGEKVDIYCDAIGMGIICSAALAAPRVSLMGKTSIAQVLAFEAEKLAWAKDANTRYRSAFPDAGPLYIKPTADGKEGMAERMTAVFSGIITHELDSSIARSAAGAISQKFATDGVHHGRLALASYEQTLQSMLE